MENTNSEEEAWNSKQEPQLLEDRTTFVNIILIEILGYDSKDMKKKTL